MRRLFVVSVAVAVALLPLVPPAATPAQAAPVGPRPGAPSILDVAGPTLINTPTATRTPTPINVGNFVWDDLDNDGRQDAGEPGLPGVTVQLWNGAKTQMIGTTVTNANGNYSLVAPLPGEYRVRVLLPGANDQFSPKDNAAAGDTADSDVNPSGTSLGFTDIYAFASNVISIVSIDAGIMVFHAPTATRTPTPINVGNFVWDDLDNDGRQDAGEPGLPGVTVQLWNGAKTQMIGTTVTNANGNYSLIAPLPGEYRVRVLLPGANDQFSPKDNAAAGDTGGQRHQPQRHEPGLHRHLYLCLQRDQHRFDRRRHHGVPRPDGDAHADADQRGQLCVGRPGQGWPAGCRRAWVARRHRAALEWGQDPDDRVRR